MHIYYRRLGIALLAFVLLGLVRSDPYSYAAKKSYSVQLGAFSKHEAARRHYESLRSDLSVENAAGLRVEKKSQFYIVRTGASLEFERARKLLSNVRPLVKDAFIVNEAVSITDELVMPAPDITAAPPEQREMTTEHSRSAEKRRHKSDQPNVSDKPVKSSGSMASRDSNNGGVKINLPEVDSRMSFFLKTKDYQSADSFIEQAISASPKNPALYAWYGASLIASNRPYQALQQFKRAAELAPGKPEYLNGIGYSYVYINQDSAEQSIGAFRKVLLDDPNNVDALEGLGAIYMSVGDKKQAYEIYHQLAAKDRKAAERLNNLLSYDFKSGEHD